MRFEVRSYSVGAGQCGWDEVHGLLQTVVRFGTTEAEEGGAGFAEAFAAEAGDATVIAHSASEIIMLGSRGTSFIFKGSTKKSKSSNTKAPINAV